MVYDRCTDSKYFSNIAKLPFNQILKLKDIYWSETPELLFRVLEGGNCVLLMYIDLFIRFNYE